MPPDSEEPKIAEPRLVRVSRRAFLRRSAAAGAFIVLPGLACRRSDSEVFAGATATVAPATVAPTAVPPTAPDVATAAPTATSPPGESAGATSPAGSEAADSGVSDSGDVATDQGEAVEPEPVPSEQGEAPVPAGAELAVAFTYVAGATSRGRILNPYVAVWVEDTAGNLVDTIGLWFLQEAKGTRWLNDLRRWYQASDQATDTTMSGATRPPGTYSVVWNGTDLSGNPVAQGDYVVYIEAAREHGPYSITSTPITLGPTPFTARLSDNVEITDASVELIV